ncbi:hypothetical protein [Halobacillus karajensis]|uniref:Uncharacterized protein n=1 Tax=Halobacillus karajensis TaxID=195088 RepID=A0A024P8Q5_9BACI|nr:hypothetical protein [Halobacillus karajensis]CDQ21227.1 hypothetical protein BN982_03593 [Halobacillus karajensis]CDQ24712.1 hypothetical protein BN983_03008 [Halobacillus karajensis]CDQ28928.1 hypothetical protein BN981_03246 [Halobacillus karajensis]
MDNFKWVKNNRIYTLRDSDGNDLLIVENRTCSESNITNDYLKGLASEYFCGLERKMEK